MSLTNDYGQPIGPALGDWTPPRRPPLQVVEGKNVMLDPLEPVKHGPSLFASFQDSPETLWTYMSIGPFPDERDLVRTLEQLVASEDWIPYAILVDGEPLGFASYLRVKPRDGVIEIGSIAFSPALQRTTAATEAIYLMIRQAFDLGYRRCEWKCDDLNVHSRRAADRLGFTYEGTFRKATHYKGRSRDTAWYAMTDSEWPALAASFQEWLGVDNFDYAGLQRRTLRQIREGRR